MPRRPRRVSGPRLPVVFRLVKHRDPRTGWYTRVRRRGWREAYLVRRTERGVIADEIRQYAQRSITKRTAPGEIDGDGGLIRTALGRLNVYTLGRGVKRVEFSARGKYRGRAITVIKGSLDIGTSRQRAKLGDLTLWQMLSAMRKRGYRTTYPASAVDWTTVRKTPPTWASWRGTCAVRG